MFVDWNAAMKYPICVFHRTTYKNGHLETYCDYPFIDIKECLYEKNKECIHQMSTDELYEDWICIKKRLSKEDSGERK